ncbi:MAG: hypothetical protein JXX14_02480 [Deltaproteobacteria bacterium]|nr:hypothetical protein [Deltaproteobacteria bacterium]
MLPQNSSEKELLQKIPSAKAGKSFKIGGATFLVTNAYFAASGRECKSVQITNPETPDSVLKIACNFDGTWGYAPDVFPKSTLQ